MIRLSLSSCERLCITVVPFELVSTFTGLGCLVLHIPGVVPVVSKTTSPHCAETRLTSEHSHGAPGPAAGTEKP